MLVGFTGAGCTGKSTLLNICKQLLPDWNFVDEVTRKVMRDGLKINEDGDNLTQLFILKEHLNNHVVSEQDNWLLDRCILDGYVYTKWLNEQGSVNNWVLTYAANLLSMLGGRLDVIFYTEPDDIQIVDDGERSINSKFRNDIVKIYENLLTNTCSTPGEDMWRHKVVRLSGDVTTRMNMIQQTLKI